MQTATQFSNERDLVKYFSLSSIVLRPEASALILARLNKLPSHLTETHKKAYLEKLIKKIKEKKQLLIHNPGAMGNSTG